MRRPVATVIALVLLLVMATTGCRSESEPVAAPAPPTVLASGAISGPLPLGPAIDGTGAADPDPVSADPSGAGLTGRELEAFLAVRYEAYWEAFDEARRLPTSQAPLDFPSLELLAAGEQLDLSYRAVSELTRRGEAIREADLPAIAGTDAASEHRVSIDRVAGPLAEISACMVNDDVRYKVADGTIVDARVTTVRSGATMALTDQGWKVIRSRAERIDEGVTGCWLTRDTAYPY